jgi:hypothetical protein
MSNQPPRRPRDDLFDRIEAEDEADDARRIVALDEAGVDRELAAGGLDPAAVRAKGRALGEERMHAAQRSRFRRIVTIAPALTAAAAVLFFLMLPGRRNNLPASGRPPGPPPSEVRRDAKRECDQGHWARCLRLLDEARDDDRAGDRAPEIQAERERAMRGLEAGAPTTPPSGTAPTP